MNTLDQWQATRRAVKRRDRDAEPEVFGPPEAFDDRQPDNAFRKRWHPRHDPSQGRMSAASTAARRAMAAGPYVAERLLGYKGRPPTIPMGTLEGYRSQELAEYYTSQFWWVWKRDNSPKALLRWVSTHPLALAELGALRGIDYAAADADNEQTREELNAEFATAIRNLDDTISMRMLEAARQAGNPHPWVAIAAEMAEHRNEW